METMKKIEVTAVFYPNGEMRPLQFTWQKRIFHVQGTGRQWQEGDQQHFLVMAENEHMFELVFSVAEACWYMGKRSSYDWTA
jgi:hypothetical protein